MICRGPDHPDIIQRGLKKGQVNLGPARISADNDAFFIDQMKFYRGNKERLSNGRPYEPLKDQFRVLSRKNLRTRLLHSELCDRGNVFLQRVRKKYVLK